MLCQLGILFYDLHQHGQCDLRDQDTVIAHTASCADIAAHRADLAQECLHFLIFEECMALHDVHVFESCNSYRHIVHLPGLHALLRSPFLEFCGRFALLSLFLFREFCLHLLDLALEVCDCAVVCFLVCGQRLNLCLDSRSLFICAVVGDLADRRLEFCLARLEFRRLCSQRLQLCFLGINLFSEHERFQCHLLFLLSAF